MSDEYATVEFEDCKKITEKAALLVIDGADYWIPFSQIASEDRSFNEGDSGEIAVKLWLLEEKGL